MMSVEAEVVAQLAWNYSDETGGGSGGSGGSGDGVSDDEVVISAE